MIQPDLLPLNNGDVLSHGDVLRLSPGPVVTQDVPHQLLCLFTSRRCGLILPTLFLS